MLDCQKSKKKHSHITLACQMLKKRTHLYCSLDLRHSERLVALHSARSSYPRRPIPSSKHRPRFAGPPVANLCSSRGYSDYTVGYTAHSRMDAVHIQCCCSRSNRIDTVGRTAAAVGCSGCNRFGPSCTTVARSSAEGAEREFLASSGVGIVVGCTSCRGPAGFAIESNGNCKNCFRTVVFTFSYRYHAI